MPPPSALVSRGRASVRPQRQRSRHRQAAQEAEGLETRLCVWDPGLGRGLAPREVAVLHLPVGRRQGRGEARALQVPRTAVMAPPHICPRGAPPGKTLPRHSGHWSPRPGTGGEARLRHSAREPTCRQTWCRSRLGRPGVSSHLLQEPRLPRTVLLGEADRGQGHRDRAPRATTSGGCF